MKARAVSKVPSAEPPNGKKKKKKKKKLSGSTKQESAVVNPHLSGGITVAAGSENAEADSLEMRRLLRGRRYFTADLDASDRCYNCNEAGHEARECPQPPRAKPCFVCGEMGHQGMDCPQKMVCYVCNQAGHSARDCRNGSSEQTECLRCGGGGHLYRECRGEYDGNDLQLVECYTCRQRGHLCCAALPPKLMAPPSCANCGEGGHGAEACGRPRGFSGTAAIAARCYRCGEEGHLARGCGQGEGGRPRARREERWQAWADEDRWHGAGDGEVQQPKRAKHGRRERGHGQR